MTTNGRNDPTPKLKVYQDRKGGWRWRLIATNGRILADSGQSYSRRSDCLMGSWVAGKAALNADVVDRFGKPVRHPLDTIGAR